MKTLSRAKKQSQKRSLEPTIRKVQTQVPLPRDIVLTITGNGLIESQNDLDIMAAVGGKIIFAKDNLKSGTFVKEGEVILEIDPRQAQNNLYLARANLINSVVSLLPDLLSKSNRKLYRKWKTYLERLDLKTEMPSLPTIEGSREKIKVSMRNIFTNFYRVKNAEIHLAQHAIRAPFSGHIAESAVHADSFVRAGQRLLKLVDTVNLEVSMPVTIEEFNRLDMEAGPKVKIYPGDDRDLSLTGKVVRNDTHIKRGSQSVYIHIALENPKLRPEFFPGNYLNLSVKGKTLKNVVLIPRYIIRDDNKVYSFKNNKLASEPVEILVIQNDMAIVANNFPDNTEIITTILQKPLLGMQLARSESGTIMSKKLAKAQ